LGSLVFKRQRVKATLNIKATVGQQGWFPAVQLPLFFPLRFKINGCLDFGAGFWRASNMQWQAMTSSLPLNQGTSLHF